MNKLPLILICLALLSGCKTTKRAVRSNTDTQKTVDVAKSIKDELSVIVDTTKTDNINLSYQKIEYFDKSKDSTITGDLRHDNIKSIETLSINKSSVKSGKSDIKQANSVDSTSTVKENTKTIVDTKEKTKQALPIKYVFYLAVLAVIIFVYIKRKTIIGKILKLF